MSPRVLALALAGLFAAVAGCSGWLARSEGLDPATVPESVRADYDLFALRCSKCHSLARPLSSGIDDDGYWAMYVARMRRQPGSGISQEDTVGILRFLHYYSLEQKRKKDKTEEPPPAPASAAPAPAAAPSGTPAPAATTAPPAAPGATPSAAPIPSAAPTPTSSPSSASLRPRGRVL
jgi:hypothetical protein